MLQKIERLISEIRAGRDESESLEFKARFWDLKNIKSQHEFLKDICGMANAICADDDRLILVGIDSSGKIHNTPLPEDEANLQQRLGKIIPEPNVKFTEIEIEGVKIVAISIMPPYDQPYVVFNDNLNLVYVRKGSRVGTASRYQLDQYYAQSATPNMNLSWTDHDNKKVDALGILRPQDIDIDSVVKDLLARKPKWDDLRFLENHRSDIIKKIRTTSGPKNFGMEDSVSLEDFLGFPDLLSRYIDGFEEAARIDPHGLRISCNTKHRKLYIKLHNNGTMPAKNITVFIESNDRVRFLHYSETLAKDYHYLKQLSDRVNKLFLFAKGKIELPKYQGFSGWKSSDMIYRISAIDNLFKNKSDSCSLDGGRIRISCDELAHGFYFTVDKYVHIRSALEAGETTKVLYTIHADNLPLPVKGHLMMYCR